MGTDKDNIQVTVRAIIQKNGKILVCYEKNGKHYFTPGGHIGPGENAEQALYRELKQELDLSIKRSFFIGAVENIFTQDGKKHHELNLIFKVEASGVKDKSLEDNIDFSFFDIDRFSKVNKVRSASWQGRPQIVNY